MANAEPLDIKQLIRSAVATHSALPFDLLHSYLSGILDWNTRAGLVSPREPLAVLDRLVDQSARLLEIVIDARGPVERAVDIGTGAGFPGVIWKMLSPQTRIVLVERRARKVTFLRRMVAVLGLSGIEVFEGEASVAAGRADLLASCDVAATMAVGGLDVTLPLARPFLLPGGFFATVLPASADPENATTDYSIVSYERGPRGVLGVFRLDE